MGYAESLLASNEQIVYESRKHWVAPLMSTITGSVLTIVGLAAVFGQLLVDNSFLSSLFLWGGVLALLVGLVMLAAAVVSWWSEHYLVTNQKVMKVAGIMRKTAEGSALEKINDITISQSLLGRWLGYGTLRVLTAADESNLNYTAMRDPMAFRKAVLDQKQEFEHQESRAIAEAVRGVTAAPAPTTPDAEQIAQTIERLAGLRDSGAITVEEFEAKKAELLGRL